MKNTILSKSIIAAVLGLSISSVSHAGVVYLTGSTAARANVFQCLSTAGAVFTAAPTITTYAGSSASGSTFMAFSGTLVGGSGTTIIDCDWSGSEAGYKDVATGTSETFIDPTSLNGLNNGTAAPSATVSHTVDVAMADNAQAYSRTTSPTVATKPVGVITFKWVRNPGLWTGANVTDSMIQNALNGFAPRALFDGNSAHVNDEVYVTGRDNSSGTRVNTYGDSGFGIFTVPNQIEINGTTGAMIDLTGGGVFEGDFGFSSGGTLAKTMGANTTAASDQITGSTGFSVIAYLGYNDAVTAIGAGATELTYDGVAFSPTAVEQGQYTFWGNEFVSHSPTADAEAVSTWTLLGATTGVTAFGDGNALISLSAMQASRSGPNSAPSHN
jgi:hypothetical protein